MTQSNEYCDLSCDNKAEKSGKKISVTQAMFELRSCWSTSNTEQKRHIWLWMPSQLHQQKRTYLPQYFLDLNSSFCRWTRDGFSIHFTHNWPWSFAAHDVITVRNIANIAITSMSRSNGQMSHYDPIHSWKATGITTFCMSSVMQARWQQRHKFVPVLLRNLQDANSDDVTPEDWLREKRIFCMYWRHSCLDENRMYLP